MNKQRIMDEVNNFIEYYSSSDEVRQQMYLALQDYLDEVYEEPSEETMVYTADVRDGEDIYWMKAVGDRSPTSYYFPQSELAVKAKAACVHGWKVIVK
jgi:hypothetical protein